MRVYPQIGFVAPSSAVPSYEFELGLARLEKAGVPFQVHPQCKKRWLFFAGTDEERAQAFLDYAYDASIQVIWCARGGYGAYRLLSVLERESKRRGKPPKKLLMGYSDATCLHEFVRTQWGWNTLHSPMPGLMSFLDIKKIEFEHLLHWIRGEQPSEPFGKKKLRFFGAAPQQAIEAELVGGNLATWEFLAGTPYAPNLSGKFLFLEDTGETLSRLDRMVQHQLLSAPAGSLRGILLGDFKDCADPVRQMCLKPKAGSKKAKTGPARPSVSLPKYFAELWGSISECYKIPVAYGLPVGHGPGKESLPLGGRYRLSPDGSLHLTHWDGLR